MGSSRTVLDLDDSSRPRIEALGEQSGERVPPPQDVGLVYYPQEYF